MANAMLTVGNMLGLDFEKFGDSTARDGPQSSAKHHCLSDFPAV